VSIFSRKAVNFGEKLLHHQLWFFGKDIWHTDGNLLIRYGFERFGVPDGKDGTNGYRLKINDLQEIVLFGFGVFWGDKHSGGIFLKRYEFNPKMLRCSSLKLPIWKKESLPHRFLPLNDLDKIATAEMFKDFSEWLAGYENWIDENCCKSWRENCLDEWENARLSINRVRQGWKILENNLEKNIYEKRNSSRIS
jgi:hypothetical protein